MTEKVPAEDGTVERKVVVMPLREEVMIILKHLSGLGQSSLDLKTYDPGPTCVFGPYVERHSWALVWGSSTWRE